MNRPRVGALLLVAAVGLTGCEGSGFLPEAGAEAPALAGAVTKEEASLLAAGKLIRFYGLEADPVPVRLLFGRATLDGEQVWKVRVLVELTVGQERVERRWTFWIGRKDGRPALLRSVEAVE